MEDAVDNAIEEEGTADVDVAELHDRLPFRRMACMAHTLPLVVKKVFKSNYRKLLTKARSLVAHIRKSFVAVCNLNEKCGKSLVSNNQTRWNSTYYMIRWMLELRSSVNEILADMKLDSMRVSEWEDLEGLCSILDPFAVETEILHSDARSLSYIVPALLELSCHLQISVNSPQLTAGMLNDSDERFSHVLQSTCANVNPLPAAACLLDPSVAIVLVTEDTKPLMEATRNLICCR